jgi:hypothetical protein
MGRIRRHLRSNVVGYIALFFALSTGSAVALGGANTVFTDDIANDNQPPSGGNPAGGLVAADLRPGSVGSSEAANNSLTGVDLAPSALTRGRTINKSSCDPADFVDCGTLEVTLTRPSRVLITATAGWYSRTSSGLGAASGECSLAVNSFRVQPARFLGETENVSAADRLHSLALTNMTSPGSLGVGSHTFGLVCREIEGDIVLEGINVSVVILGST